MITGLCLLHTFAFSSLSGGILFLVGNLGYSPKSDKNFEWKNNEPEQDCVLTGIAFAFLLFQVCRQTWEKVAKENNGYTRGTKA